MESKFKVTYADNVLQIVLAGRLDAANAPGLSDELIKYKGQKIDDMIFDAKNLEYISSAGIRVIVFAKQKIGENSRILLRGATEAVRDVINMTGLANFMIIQDT
jgi:stage II sporulation protein AA (anti-sigma F factor antagonist)